VLVHDSARLLGPRDDDDVARVLATDPVTDVFVAGRLAAGLPDHRRLGAEVWGYPARGPLRSLCWVGANLVPVQADEAAATAFGRRAAAERRRSSSIVGPRDAVLPLWANASRTWGAAREIRTAQPFLVADRPAPVRPDPLVRPVRPSEVDVLFPASVAMYAEEVGVSPLVAGGAAHRARLAETIAMGHALARIEHGEVVFKAEIGAVTRHACQVQGVWVDPRRRGQGHGVAGMAAVVDYALRWIAPTVTLYVNDFNVRARSVYRVVGFRERTTFASVLF
jgi:hypothetical protein